MQYTKKEHVIVVRLFKGEELIESVKSVCIKEKISSGRVQAIGAVQRAILGYFDTEEKQYLKFECKGEVVSCMGNIAERDGELVVHAHAVISEKDGTCKGGHVFSAEASATLEIFIESVPGLARTLDKETGLFLLNL
ncbi:MAG: DUF296 domain-containing protein [Theionarchaea archaeon]|nr:DUF296 domain-containing protein [Theionarchaea archaeon]MBU7038554.1 DUF296 domain-containing protein [Theionarchaea archaeon]